MSEQEQRARIEQYLLNGMPSAERQQFEARLQIDDALAAQVKVQRIELDAIDVLVANDLRQRVQQWKKQKPQTKFRFWPWLLGLGLIVGAASLRLWQTAVEKPQSAPEQLQEEPAQQKNGESEQQKLTPSAPSVPRLPQAEQKKTTPSAIYLAAILQAYDQPKLISSLRNAEAGQETSRYAQALQALQAGQYQQVLNLVEQMTPLEQENGLYLQAHAYFGLRRFDAAAQSFRQLREAQSISYLDAADWFELLSLLALSKAQDQSLMLRLQQIATDQEHQFHQAAKALIQTLK